MSDEPGLLDDETYRAVPCAGCGRSWPTYDAYRTTREHPIGEGKWLCPHCVIGRPWSREVDR